MAITVYTLQAVIFRWKSFLVSKKTIKANGKGGVIKVELKDKIAWAYKGYRDALEDTPYKRCFESAEEHSPLEVKFYWLGWKAGIRENQERRI